MYREYDIHDWETYGYPGEYVYGEDVYIDDYYAEELWKPIRGFAEKYWISTCGRVWSVKSQQFMKAKTMDGYGHLGVCLTKNGNRYYRYIHRLVAEAFIPNPGELPIVRHRINCPAFNEIGDVEWGTQLDNIHDAIRDGSAYRLSDEDREKGFEKIRTPIIATNLRTGEKLRFIGQNEASRVLGIPQANIWKVLNGQRGSAQGYYFEYSDRG